MKNQDYNTELLTHYLFGELSEEETERLDELSFTDDELAARLREVETDLVDAYVRGELSGQQLERFTSQYLASPVRLEKIAMARGLQNSLDRIVVTEQEKRQPQELRQPISPDKPAARRGSLRDYFFAPRATWQWGIIAALLLLIVGGGWLAFDNLRLRNQIHQAQAQREELQKRERELQAQIAEEHSSSSEKEKELTDLREQLAQLEIQAAATSSQKPPASEPKIAAFLLAPQLRGSSQLATLTIPADADFVKIQLELEPSDFTVYRAELKPLSGNEAIWRSGALRPRGAKKTLSVILRPTVLKAHSYRLEVYGVSARGASEFLSNYPFRVVK